MAQKVHKAGVNPNFLMTRRLSVRCMTEVQRNQTTIEIVSLSGVDEVSWRKGGDIIEVMYDASRRQLADIEDVLCSHGYAIAQDWRTRFRRSWYRYTDENVRSHARHVPQCCNKPPR